MHENKFFSNIFKIGREIASNKRSEETFAMVEKILSQGILVDFPFNRTRMPDDTNNLFSGRQMNEMEQVYI